MNSFENFRKSKLYKISGFIGILTLFVLLCILIFTNPGEAFVDPIIVKIVFSCFLFAIEGPLVFILLGISLLICMNKKDTAIHGNFNKIADVGNIINIPAMIISVIAIILLMKIYGI